MRLIAPAAAGASVAPTGRSARRAAGHPLVVDRHVQGHARELRPELLESACAAASLPLTLRRHAGYDHSYYFVASMIEDHLRHHAAALVS